MDGQPIDSSARWALPEPVLTMAAGQTVSRRAVVWTRRGFLVRLAASLGAAVALSPTVAQPSPVTARVLGPARNACACGGSPVASGLSQTAGAERMAPAPQAARVFENRVGWAYSPRWQKSRDEIVADLRRMRDLGCNTVYVGHNSAGNTDPDAYEPGLAPANWYAIAAATPNAGNAHLIAGTIATTLDAAREVGLDVVLGIGYQIMMGDEWNAAHQSELPSERPGRPAEALGFGVHGLAVLRGVPP